MLLGRSLSKSSTDDLVLDSAGWPNFDAAILHLGAPTDLGPIEAQFSPKNGRGFPAELMTNVKRFQNV